MTRPLQPNETLPLGDAPLPEPSRGRTGRAKLSALSLAADVSRHHRVLVIEAGHILEEDTPEELIARGGWFAALVELEAVGWDWRSE